MSNEKTSTGGISLIGLLGLAFIILKLCKVISWSWWWVTSPFWIPAGLALLAGIVYLVLLIVDVIKDK